MHRVFAVRALAARALFAVALATTAALAGPPHLLHVARMQPAGGAPVTRSARSADATPPSCADAQGNPIVPCTITLQYFGGHVIANVKVYVVFWGSNVNASVKATTGGIADFYAAVVNSEHMDFLNEYNTDITVQAGAQQGNAGTGQLAGRGTFAGSFTITPSVSGSNLLDADITSELDHQITAGVLPPPDANTIYMLYFASDVLITGSDGSKSCDSFCAYHSTYLRGGKSVYYGVMPDMNHNGCQNGCGSGTQFENTCAASSHELFEAITDAEVGLVGNTLGAPLAWYDSEDQSQGEVGDMCNQQVDQIFDINDSSQSNPYVVQQIYSARSNLCVTTEYATNDFGVALDPNTLTLSAGDSGITVPIFSGVTNGTVDSLTLSVDPASVPAGITYSFDPGATITPGDSVNLVLSAAAGAASVKDAVLVLKATGATTHTVSLLLNVTGAVANDFLLSPSPQDLSVPIGANATFTIQTGVAAGAAEAITLSASGLPSGFTAAFSPNPVTAGASSTLTLTAHAGQSPAASAPFSVHGVSPSQAAGHTATPSLQVTGLPGAAITSPASGATVSGNSVTFSATASAGQFGLLDATAGLVLKIDNGSAVKTGTLSGDHSTSAASYTWNTVGLAAGSHTLSAIAKDDDGGTSTSSITVTVSNASGNGFGLSITQGSGFATAGGTAASYTVATTVTGTAEAITLSASGLPSGVNPVFTPNPVTAGNNATLTLTAPGGTSPANATTFTVKGVSTSVPSPGHTATSAVTVIAPPTVSLTAPAAGTLSGTVNVTAAATVDLNTTVASLTLYEGSTSIGSGTGTSKTVAWDTTTVADGSYSLTAKVTDGAGNSVTSSAVSVTVHNAVASADFNLSLSPALETLAAGSTATITVATTVSGAAGQVTLAVGGLPAGVTGAFSPNPIAAGSSSTLTLTAAGNTAATTATVTVTGTEGSATHQVTNALTTTAGATGTLGVTLTSPSAGATLSGTVQLAATATLVSSTTLTRIDFLVDNSVVGNTAVSPGTFNWDTTTVAGGAHTVAAKVTDSAGNTATSAAVAVTVQQATSGGGGGGGGCSSFGGGELISLCGLFALGWRRRRALAA